VFSAVDFRRARVRLPDIKGILWREVIFSGKDAGVVRFTDIDIGIDLMINIIPLSEEVPDGAYLELASQSGLYYRSEIEEGGWVVQIPGVVPGEYSARIFTEETGRLQTGIVVPGNAPQVSLTVAF
jgi:hypothetical protein